MANGVIAVRDHSLTPASVNPNAPPPFIREAVRELLLQAPAYQQLDAVERRALASAMVRVCSVAAALIQEEAAGHAQAMAARAEPGPVFAEAQASRRAQRGPQMPPMAGQVGAVTRSILNAVAFPRFVTELINGVFKAMIDSSIQQMHSFVDLLNNVAASTDDFADSNVGPEQARSWLRERYPGAFEPATAQTGDDIDTDSDAGLRLREGASLPAPNVLRTDLGLGETDPAPSGDPERSLVPLVRRQLARNRQQVLASMVMLGMQRIVIDSGEIHAAMRFHIDTRDAENSDRGSIFNLQNQINASGQVSVGIWGASASMTNTIGYVSTQRSQSTHEMNTDLELTSSVDIRFKSDYLPLNRLAAPGQVEQIQANSRNPAAEAAESARTRRLDAAHQDETARRGAVERVLQPATPQPVSAETPGSPEYTRNLVRNNQDAHGSQTNSGSTSQSGSDTSATASNQSGSGEQTPAAPSQERQGD